MDFSGYLENQEPTDLLSVYKCPIYPSNPSSEQAEIVFALGAPYRISGVDEYLRAVSEPAFESRLNCRNRHKELIDSVKADLESLELEEFYVSIRYNHLDSDYDSEKHFFNGSLEDRENGDIFRKISENL